MRKGLDHGKFAMGIVPETGWMIVSASGCGYCVGEFERIGGFRGIVVACCEDVMIEGAWRNANAHYLLDSDVTLEAGAFGTVSR